MVSAYTTAAVLNTGFCRPEEPASPLDYMPNHSAHVSPDASSWENMTDAEKQAESDFNRAVMRARFAMVEAQHG